MLIYMYKKKTFLCPNGLKNNIKKNENPRVGACDDAPVLSTKICTQFMGHIVVTAETVSTIENLYSIYHT